MPYISGDLRIYFQTFIVIIHFQIFLQAFNATLQRY